MPENPAINIWKNWSKCFYFYHTPSFLSYNVLCIKGIWQKTKKKTENCESGSRITAQSLAWPPVRWYCFLCRILIQVLCCTAQIFPQKELLNSIIRQLPQEDSLEDQETNVPPHSCLIPEASVKQIFFCFCHNRFCHFTAGITSLPCHIFPETLHQSKALLP